MCVEDLFARVKEAHDNYAACLVVLHHTPQGWLPANLGAPCIVADDYADRFPALPTVGFDGGCVVSRALVGYTEKRYRHRSPSGMP